MPTTTTSLPSAITLTITTDSQAILDSILHVLRPPSFPSVPPNPGTRFLEGCIEFFGSLLITLILASLCLGFVGIVGVGVWFWVDTKGQKGKWVVEGEENEKKMERQKGDRRGKGGE
ncbi:MAG: hypothetical protein M1827_003638 [Pycnora praestabilis]|nr:MAG: hypothetical protein M1827_003638 [Pycnora praestabilis]